MKQILAFCCAALLAACGTQTVTSQPPILSNELQPYLTVTSSPSPAGPVGLVAAQTPLPSPTPFTYTVKSGETMGSIALKFNVSLDDLQAANPQVSPNAMPVGQVLKIPSDPANPSGEPTPAPVAFTVRQIQCYPTLELGMWCFVLAHNDFSDFIENVSAQVTLVDSTGAQIASQTAYLPLNILPPNSSLPLMTYFPPKIPTDARPQVQILTAIRLLPGDARYLPATAQNVLTQVDWRGHEAQVSGQILLPAESRAAAAVWVAATAYDESGRVVGVRRWEGGGIQPGGNLPFTMTVPSLGGEVTRVEVAVEARP